MSDGWQARHAHPQPRQPSAVHTPTAPRRQQPQPTCGTVRTSALESRSPSGRRSTLSMDRTSTTWCAPAMFQPQQEQQQVNSSSNSSGGGGRRHSRSATRRRPGLAECGALGYSEISCAFTPEADQGTMVRTKFHLQRGGNQPMVYGAVLPVVSLPPHASHDCTKRAAE